MFEVGFSEIILILGLALLVLGPERLPGLAAKIGRWTGRARAMARQLRTQLEQEVTMEELARSRPMQPSSPPTDNTIHPHPPHAETAAHTGTAEPVSYSEAAPATPTDNPDAAVSPASSHNPR
jgi:sec-independent protein translocase protein TatB